MGHGSEQDAARAAMLSAVLVPDGLVDLKRTRSFVPAEWAGRASVGLDGVVRVAHPGARPALPAPVREHLAALAPALAGQRLSGDDAVDALDAAHRLTTVVADARLHATTELTARTGEEMLRLKGRTSPEELSRTASERWRARSKSLTAAEIQALTGLGRDTARELVAIANAPQITRVPARQGLSAGIAGWDLVLAWWRRCTKMPHENSAVVARALFGTDVPLDEVAHERLTPEGELSTQPWAKRQFFDALEREARLQEGLDPAGQEKKRQAQHESRDAYAVVDDDGTAQLVIRGDVVSVTGCIERLQDLARRARDEGDPRTVSQLRSDLARALVRHGTLPLPDLGDDPNFITPEDIERLVDVLSATPATELQVIVPWDVLTGHAAIVNPCPTDHPAGDDAHQRAITDCTAPGQGRATTDADSITETTTSTETGTGGPDVLEGVGRVLGRDPRFLSATEVRAIAGRPGTTLYRLLTDPADGRCIERSVARYAPDAAMRAQIRAADVFSRAPGSTVPAHRSDLDHVQEYLLGGSTSESNLQALDRTWHAQKTEKFWDAVMDGSRNVTWESFWGRLYRTRPHDYRQYLTRPWPQGSSSPPGGPGAATGHSDEATGSESAPSELTPTEQRHLASLLVYAALAHRRPGERLEALDDDPDSDAEVLDLRDAVWIRHTTTSGRRTTGPAPGTPSPEQLINHDPRSVLDHPAWTTLGKADAAPHADDAAQGDDTDEAVPDPPAEPPPF